jgi:hypothetical protein
MRQRAKREVSKIENVTNHSPSKKKIGAGAVHKATTRNQSKIKAKI